MAAFADDRIARRSILLSLLCATLAVVIARSASGALVHAPGPVALTLALAALAALVRAALARGSEARIAAADTLAATTRAASCLIVCVQWASDARELLGALVVATVWIDAANGASRARPLAPLGLALAWAIGWSAVRPSEAVPRAAAVAAIAAFGVERFARRAEAEGERRS